MVGENMKDKSKLVALILVVVTVIVVILSFIFKKEEEQEKGKIYLVSNYSSFYTVNSCLYRTISYISSKDIDSLMLVLTDEYKENNGITKDNVMNFITNIEEDSTFTSKKMYYEKINANITKYYVYGTVQKNEVSDNEIVSHIDNMYLYFIVYMDTENKIFSVEPYSGDIFIGGDLNG